MGEMFSGCSGLVSLDLSSFVINNKRSYVCEDMFHLCESLQTVKTTAVFPENSQFNEAWRV
jgi:hypothetical protein